MSKLREKAASLLKGGTVKLIIGFERGTTGARPLFCRTVEDTERLIYNDDCRNNLAVYLTKREIIGEDNIAIVATYRTLQSILQLNKENQINKEKLSVLTVDRTDETREFSSFDEMRQYVNDNVPAPDPKVAALIEKIEKMSREERWKYWQSELSKCIRCYACRAACPLCYCNRCVTEVNCPQWIDPWNSALSNMEWQINRVMHMSGRCTGCGACVAACPLGLPIGILTKKMAQDIQGTFGNTEKSNVLSTFNPNDKENFIK